MPSQNNPPEYSQEMMEEAKAIIAKTDRRYYENAYKEWFPLYSEHEIQTILNALEAAEGEIKRLNESVRNLRIAQISRKPIQRIEKEHPNDK